MTGTGTQTDPYIVSSWSDFGTALRTADVYIKWADSEDKLCDLGGAMFTSSVIWAGGAVVDFNGWILKNFTFKAPALTTGSSGYDYTKTSMFLLKSTANFTSEIKNLIVEDFTLDVTNNVQLASSILIGGYSSAYYSKATNIYINNASSTSSFTYVANIFGNYVIAQKCIFENAAYNVWFAQSNRTKCKYCELRDAQSGATARLCTGCIQYTGDSYSFIDSNGTPEAIDDDGVRYPQFNNLDDEDWSYRINADVNGGMPFLPFWKYPFPVPLYIQPSKPLIHVYDSRETDFDSNGFAVIMPISCEVRQEKNGMYEAELECDIDSDGKFKHLKNQGILKIPIKYHGETKEQIFRISSTKRSMDSSGNYRISATARHIFYDLNDRLLVDCRPTSKNGKDALSWIYNGTYGASGKYDIDFAYYSDINTVTTAYYQNVSVTSALLGEDNAFVNRWGGSIYRDNYYFSINYDTEYSRSTGVIRYGYNMIDIEFTADYSECVTYLIATDNFGNRKTIINSAVPCEEFPHHIYRTIKFSYDYEDKAQFEADAQAYFDNYKQASVNIKVKFADLSDIELYADFLRLADFEVGDKVIIYHKDLDINYGNLEIISKTYDVVSGETVDIEIGTFKNAISRSGFMPETASSGQSTADKQLAAVQAQLDEAAFAVFITTPITTIDGKYLTTSDGKYLLYKE